MQGASLLEPGFGSEQPGLSELSPYGEGEVGQQWFSVGVELARSRIWGSEQPGLSELSPYKKDGRCRQSFLQGSSLLDPGFGDPNSPGSAS